MSALLIRGQLLKVVNPLDRNIFQVLLIRKRQIPVIPFCTSFTPGMLCTDVSTNDAIKVFELSEL